VKEQGKAGASWHFTN